jgi:hypothetical protein
MALVVVGKVYIRVRCTVDFGQYTISYGEDLDQASRLRELP